MLAELRPLNADQMVEDELVPTPMILTDDPEAILRFALESLHQRQLCALVTLTAIDGGGSRAIGTQMAVRDDGFYCGYVSGGCVESAVAAEAMDAMAQGRDRELVLGRNSPFFDIALPCGGSIRLTIHVLRGADALEHVIDAIGVRERTGLVYLPDRQHLRPATAAEIGISGWCGEIFVRSYRPRTRLVIHGRSVELAATAAIATASGFDVIPLADEVPADTLADIIDRDTAVVFLHHDIDREMRSMRAALESEAFYIGALGSHRTHQRRCEELRLCGFEPGDIARIKAPIGLIPRTRDANALAVSVVADVVAADLYRDEQARAGSSKNNASGNVLF